MSNRCGSCQQQRNCYGIHYANIPTFLPTGIPAPLSTTACVTCPAGATGATGATGSGGLGGYGYIYNLTGETVAIGAPIPYDSNGLMTAAITHTPGSPTITVTVAGIYKVTYIKEGSEPNQFSLFQNGVNVAGSIYPSGAGTQPNVGNVIVSASAGDTFQVLNNASPAAVTLATPIGGTNASVNASILFEKIG